MNHRETIRSSNICELKLTGTGKKNPSYYLTLLAIGTKYPFIVSALHIVHKHNIRGKRIKRQHYAKSGLLSAAFQLSTTLENLYGDCRFFPRIHLF